MAASLIYFKIVWTGFLFLPFKISTNSIPFSSRKENSRDIIQNTFLTKKNFMKKSWFRFTRYSSQKFSREKDLKKRMKIRGIKWTTNTRSENIKTLNNIPNLLPRKQRYQVYLYWTKAATTTKGRNFRHSQNILY